MQQCCKDNSIFIYISIDNYTIFDLSNTVKNNNLKKVKMNYSRFELHENANYIINILNRNKNVMWAWGANAFRYLEHEGKKALRFRVRGFQHTGFVYVLYNAGRDVFEVLCTDLKGNIKKENRDVFFDELTYCIDAMVEVGNMTNEQYAEKCGKAVYNF